MRKIEELQIKIEKLENRIVELEKKNDVLDKSLLLIALSFNETAETIGSLYELTMKHYEIRKADMEIIRLKIENMENENKKPPYF